MKSTDLEKIKMKNTDLEKIKITDYSEKKSNYQGVEKLRNRIQRITEQDIKIPALAIKVF